MRMPIITLMALLASSPVAGAEKQGAVDPAAAIREGRYRCGWPDIARKTCLSIARYTPRVDGGYDVRVRGAPGNDGLILSYSSRSRVYRGAVCVTITNADMLRSTFTKAGVPLVGSALPAMRQKMLDWYAPLLEHEVCDFDEPPDAKGVAASSSTVDGKAVAELDRPVKWVSDADGFTLAAGPDEMT